MILPEIIMIGIYDSAVAARNLNISKKRKTSMFEIELPIEQGGISYIESSSRQITPQTVICAKPGQTRHTKFPFKCYYLHMMVKSGRLYDLLMNTPDIFETANREVYEDIFKKLVKHYNALSESEDVILQSLVLELVYTIVKESGDGVKHSTASGNPVIEKALEYIKAHLTESLTLESVANAVALSPIHFHNFFKKSVGKTLREYVEEQRIKKATGMLLTTNDSLTKIAFECGFSSQSYFSYVFKRKMKTTPREYVKDVYAKYGI